MVRWLTSYRASPIGVDVGNRSVKLVQFNTDCSSLIDASRWEIPACENDSPSVDEQIQQISDTIRMARDGRKFVGRDAVLCLSSPHLFLQSIRLPLLEGPELNQLVYQEAAGRIPFPISEAEIRFIKAANIRQGDHMLREVIVLACHRPVLEQMLQAIEQAGLNPVAVDVEPAALLRSYTRQYRRDEDQNQRTLLVHVGFTTTAVLIVQGSDIMFVKYIDIGGRNFDESVARHLKMDNADATSLRRHNGDRRIEQQDPVIRRSVSDSMRPIIDQLSAEISMCIRYNSVTFRGQPIIRLLLGGGEASTTLLEAISERVHLKCEMSEPLRGLTPALTTHQGQWDVSTGLALRPQQ